jgi:hypothetical protein
MSDRASPKKTASPATDFHFAGVQASPLGVMRHQLAWSPGSMKHFSCACPAAIALCASPARTQERDRADELIQHEAIQLAPQQTRRARRGADAGPWQWPAQRRNRCSAMRAEPRLVDHLRAQARRFAPMAAGDATVTAQYRAAARMVGGSTHARRLGWARGAKAGGTADGGQPATRPQLPGERGGD